MIELYPRSIHDRYLKKICGSKGGIDAVCQEIKKACEGAGTNEKKLIELLGSKSLDDRSMIACRYKDMFKCDLHDLIASETSGSFGFLLELMSYPLPQAEAFAIKKALSGFGTREDMLIPILMGRTNDEITILRQVYHEMYQIDLAVALADDLSGGFEKIITMAIQGAVQQYDQNIHSLARAESDAKRLYEAGEGKWGTDENSFIKIILTSPPEHLMKINEVYKSGKVSGRDAASRSDLVSAIESEFSGPESAALVFHVRSALNALDLICDHFHSSIAGFGTNEENLSCDVIRYQGAFSRIAQHYQLKYKVVLKDQILGETSNEYQDLLKRILDAPASHASGA